MNRQSILLVEDNPDDIALMLHALSDNQIANPVVVVEDGEQALQTLFGAAGQAERGVPALILLDLNLPNPSAMAWRYCASCATTRTPVWCRW